MTTFYAVVYESGLAGIAKTEVLTGMGRDAVAEILGSGTLMDVIHILLGA